jgi:hypothetical protein
MASPTLTAYSPATGASARVRDYVNSSDITPSVFAGGVRSFRWNATQSVATTSFNFGFNWTASAEL